ncbi:MAG: hypothetical protein ACREP7_14945 [Lysobacter sp.]
MRIYNINLPGDDTIGDQDANAKLEIAMADVPGSVYFRLRDVTVDLALGGEGIEFDLVTNSGHNRIRVANGEHQNPPRFYNVSVGGAPTLRVYYGNGFEGTGEGLLEATIEYSFNDSDWTALSEWPGEYVVTAGGFLTADAGGAEDCFWTRLILTTQECESPVQPTTWFGSGENGYIGVTSPDSIGNGNGGWPYAGYAIPPGFDQSLMVGCGSRINLGEGSDFREVTGATSAQTYTGEVANLRILKLSKIDLSIVDTYPVPGTFASTTDGQDQGYRGTGWSTIFSGTLPAFDAAFYWSFVADVTLTGDGGGGSGPPLTGEISGSYTFAENYQVLVKDGEPLPMLFEGPQYCDADPGGLGCDQSPLEQPFAGFLYHGWFFPPCDQTSSLDFTVDGDATAIPVSHRCT